MRRSFLMLTIVLAVATGFALSAWSADWIDKTLVAAADKTLTTMPADFYQVEPAAAQQQMESAKPFVLDVRETKEFAAGKIPGAVNIPIRDLPKALAKLPDNKNTPIVTYCAVGYRGGMSVMVLRMWGYTNVRTIKGGITAWEKAGLPLDKS
jgi:rhodanese-related sulfurtransferase